MEKKAQARIARRKDWELTEAARNSAQRRRSLPVSVWIAFLFLAGFVSGNACRSAAQMVSPEIDNQPGPFSYFSKPTDEIGVYGAPSGAEITPEGYVYTGYGELMFFVGPEQTPVNARIRTLEEGDLPILQYTVSHLGIAYRFTIFSAGLGKRQPGGKVANFIRVTVTNPGKQARAAFLATAFRYQAEQTTEAPTGDNRFRRPIAASGVGQFHQPGERFSKDWSYSADSHAFLRDGRILYRFPATPRPGISLTLRSHYNRRMPTYADSIPAEKLDIEPTTPTSVASYAVPLAAGESRNLDFVMPLEPMEAGDGDREELTTADFQSYHDAVAGFWRETLSRGMAIEVPEAKVVDTFRASLLYNLLALNRIDGQPVQTVNQFQYHRFYLRDASDIVRMYDATGYGDIAAQVLTFFPSRQQPDGNFLSQPGQYDGWGEALWTYAEHYRRSHDSAFAERVFPQIARAVDWLVKARSADPMRLMPVSDVKDNEYVTAHLTGYNFLALDGLQGAIELARATHHDQEAASFDREYRDYRKTFFEVLDRVTKRTGGYIPPSLDSASSGETGDAKGWQGTDWGNLLSVTPEPVLAANDPRVTATLQHLRSQYQEGIATYAEPDDGQFLHHYLTIKNTLTELARGEQEQAMREFYAELLHTSSTHAGFEYAIRPWGSRDFEGNLAPHGWFAADYRNLLRNMMVREENGALHLLSAVSPEWIGAGKSIRVEHAPTYFGVVSFELEMKDANSANLHLRTAFPSPPRQLVLHVPWFMQLDGAASDAGPVSIIGDSILMPVHARELRLAWHRKPNAASMSYEKTVQSYRAEYRRRFEILLGTGGMQTGPDSWRVPD